MKKILIITIISLLLIITSSCTPAEPPEIQENWLTVSAEVLKMNIEVDDAEIIRDGGKLSFYIVPSGEREVSIDRMRELGIDFLKIFAGYAVDGDIAGPTDDSLGEIYDYYDVEIIVEGPTTVLEKGTKARGSKEIIWEGQKV